MTGDLSDRRAADRARRVDPALVLDGAHPHGFLLTLGPSGAVVPDVEGWRIATDVIAGAVLHLQPRAVLSHVRGAAGTVALLGHPVDVAAGVTDGGRIASRLVSMWSGAGADGLVREAAELGGRWTLLAVDAVGRELLVIPDTHATQPVFHATAGPRLALASSASLVAQALGLPVDDGDVELLAELRRRRPRRVVHLPGRHTAYHGVDPLVPNCLLRITAEPGDPEGAPHVRHERFWPWREREETEDVDAVFAAFEERLTAHTELLAGLGRPAISLTAGGDSRVTAAVARTHLRERDGFAFTYVNPRDARNSARAMADVTGASAVADQLGIPHRLLRWRQPPADGTFDVLHRRTYAPLLPSRGAAYAMWADLPGDLVQLQSNCAETGTAFFRRRTDEPVSPLRLAQLVLAPEEGPEDLAEVMYGDYLDYAQMTPDRMLGYDHHDLFYWEQRMGRWGWQKFVDGDFGHRILLPFNDRVLLETMLSLPYPQREGKVLLQRVLDAEPGARVPSRTPRLGSVVREAAARRLPAQVRHRVQPVLRYAEDQGAVSRLAFSGGYAVLPPGATEVAVPTGWRRTELPGGLAGQAPSGAVLHRHPGLAYALVGHPKGWVLVLGEPVWVGPGLAGAVEVARALGGMVAGPHATQPPGRAETLDAVVTPAAALAGRYVVVAGDGDRTVVVPDPLTALGLHLLDDGAGLVSHERLTDRSTAPVLPDTVLRSVGPGLAPTPLGDLVDLAAVAEPSGPDAPASRSDRLARHTRLLRRRGAAWLGLTAGTGSSELLDHLLANAGSAVTWWDRAAGDRVAAEVFTASDRAWDANVQHRVVGLREDLDGSDTGVGQSARLHAAEALRRTWGEAADELVPLSPALEQALPRHGMLWLGSRESGALGDPTTRPWELVQGVRSVALPFSDRLLPLLPAR